MIPKSDEENKPVQMTKTECLVLYYQGFITINKHSNLFYLLLPFWAVITGIFKMPTVSNNE